MWKHEGTEEMGVKVVCVSTKLLRIAGKARS